MANASCVYQLSIVYVVVFPFRCFRWSLSAESARELATARASSRVELLFLAAAGFARVVFFSLATWHSRGFDGHERPM